MSENMGRGRPFDALSEGAEARRRGKPKDSCPHPERSKERADWMEGWTGIDDGGGPDLPLDDSH